MAKKIRTIVRLAILGVPTFALLCFVTVLVCITTRCGWTRFGPYHEAALIRTFSEHKVIPNLHGGLISLGGKLNLLKGGEASEVKTSYHVTRYVSEEGKLYALYPQKTVLLNDNWSEEDSYPFGVDFIVKGKGYKRDMVNGGMYLVCYDMQSGQKDSKFQEIPLIDGSYLTIDGHHVFIDGAFNVIDDGINEIYAHYSVRQKPKEDEKPFLCWPTGEIECDSNTIVSVLSPICDGCFYYSVTKKVISSDCVAHKGAYYPCICEFGESVIYKIDTATKASKESFVLQAESVPIRVSDGCCTYYYKGGIYENGIEIQKTRFIKTGGDYYELGDDWLHNDSPHSSYALGYYDGCYYNVEY